MSMRPQVGHPPRGESSDESASESAGAHGSLTAPLSGNHERREEVSVKSERSSIGLSPGPAVPSPTQPTPLAEVPMTVAAPRSGIHEQREEPAILPNPPATLPASTQHRSCSGVLHIPFATTSGASSLSTLLRPDAVPTAAANIPLTGPSAVVSTTAGPGMMTMEPPSDSPRMEEVRQWRHTSFKLLTPGMWHKACIPRVDTEEEGGWARECGGLYGLETGRWTAGLLCGLGKIRGQLMDALEDAAQAAIMRLDMIAGQPARRLEYATVDISIAVAAHVQRLCLEMAGLNVYLRVVLPRLESTLDYTTFEDVKVWKVVPVRLVEEELSATPSAVPSTISRPSESAP
ncbi:hypothetical protein C8Q73DRAFT_796341 [Cubamyces lactineus]|nr:hypothetical protein C8Q73DRAFT_796341 [Cubamyces lactineus]